MQDFNSIAIEEGMSKQLTDDLVRMLAGTNVRANGSEITGNDLQEQIKALLGTGANMSTDTTVAPADTTNWDKKKDSIAAENFAPTVSGVNSSSGAGNGNYQGNMDKARNPDVAMPNSLRNITGADTVGEFLGNSMLNVGLAALTAVNPIAGLAAKGLSSVIKGVDPLDSLADIFAGMNPVTSIAKTTLNAVGAYDEAEGLVTSTADAYKTLNTIDHVPTTLAGRNVINTQVENERAKTGTYDSSRGVQQRASAAALARDNAPAYASPNYGAKLDAAKNPAATAPAKADSSKGGGYTAAGGIGKTQASAGHTAAGGVGPSPSGGSSKNDKGGGGSKGSGGSSSGGSSKGSGGGKNGGTGSNSYGGR